MASEATGNAGIELEGEAQAVAVEGSEHDVESDDEIISDYQEKALDAAFDLAMTMRCYTSALSSCEDLGRQWILRRIAEQVAVLAAAVIEPIERVERIENFEVFGIPV